MALFARSVFILYAIGVVWPTSGGAAEPSSSAKQDAATHFERGVKLYKAQDYSSALSEFEAAYRAVPRFEVLFNVGVTQKRLFHYGESVHALKRYLEEGKGHIPPDRVELVSKELAEIKSLVAEVTVDVSGMPANIEVDGEFVAQMPLTEPLLLRSGRHTITAKRDGYEPGDKVLDVVSSTQMTVKLELREKVEVSTVGKLTVHSKPHGAQLVLDGKSIGKEPWVGNVDPGGHEVVGLLSGFQKTRMEVLLNPGQAREITVELTGRKRPWYKQWYVWTPIILAVGGGVTAAVLLTRSQPDVTISYPPHP